MCRIAGPYSFRPANILELFADAQVFAVALVGLVLRMEEGMYDREFFCGNVILALLVSTLLVATLYSGGARSWLQVRQRWPSPAATY